MSECEKVQSTALLPSLLLLHLLKMMLALRFSVVQYFNTETREGQCGVRDKWDQLFYSAADERNTKHQWDAALEGPREVVHGWLPLPVWFICFLWREKGIPKTSCALWSGQVSEVTVSRSALASACGSKTNLQFQHFCLKPQHWVFEPRATIIKMWKDSNILEPVYACADEKHMRRKTGNS